MTRGVALSLVVILATAASVISRAASTAAIIPNAKLTTISSKADARSATLVIEATEPVPYVATRPDPLTVMVDFRNVDAGAIAAAAGLQARGPIASVRVESAEALGSPVSRVRIALAQPVTHHVRADRNRILIDFDRSELLNIAPPAEARLAQPIVQTTVDPIAALGLSGKSTRSAPRQAVQVFAASQAPAQAPAAQASVGQLLGNQAGGRTYSGNPVSLDFQQADLRAVLRVFAEISGLNIVIDPAVRGTVDVALRDVPWDQALDIILRANKLGYMVDGTIARIARTRSRLAVLPFGPHDGFTAGLSEEALTQLVQSCPRSIGVIARTSVEHARREGGGAAEIARALSADYLLEGHVRREGDRVRITAQLIQSHDETHIWASTFDRVMTDALSVQSDVASAIAKAVVCSIAPAIEGG